VYFQGSNVECPAKIDNETRKRIEETARSAFKLFGCSGYARVDLRMSHSGELKVLEVNPNPIVTGYGISLQAQAADSLIAVHRKLISIALREARLSRQLDPSLPWTSRR